MRRNMIYSHKVILDFTIYDSASELDKEDYALLKAAQEATSNAYAPYSGFHVGAAILLNDGSIAIGTNQENAAYPSGLCAERTAIFGAMSNNPGKKILKIAITARRKSEGTFLVVSPCGACRQVMIEYENLQNNAIKIIMQGKDSKVITCNSVDALLPLKFTEEALNI